VLGNVYVSPYSVAFVAESFWVVCAATGMMPVIAAMINGIMFFCIIAKLFIQLSVQ
jgi:hypothetical protein